MKMTVWETGSTVSVRIKTKTLTVLREWDHPIGAETAVAEALAYFKLAKVGWEKR